jgi:hypothetical protein
MSRPIARTGEPARTQLLTSYDAGTRTYVGNKSRVTFTKNVGEFQTFLGVDATFTVTPLVGDAYQLTEHVEYTVTPGAVFAFFIEYPWIVGAYVRFERAVFSSFKSIYDDFESYQVGERLSLPAIISWPAQAFFAAPPPNAEAFDDFEAYTTAADQQVSTWMQGYGWADGGQFNAYDDTNCYDDFESYAVGALSLMTQGVGWVRPGFIVIVDEIHAWDDFESYAVGSITVLTDNTSTYWNGDGVITAHPDITAWDDFESYAVGSITVLNAVGGNWNGNGSIN